MSMQNVYFRGESAPNQQYNVPQQTQQQVVTNPIVKKSRPELVSQEAAMAMRAYTLQDNLNFKGAGIGNLGTAKEYIEQLTSKGLKEGKDFTVEKDGKFTEVHLKRGGQTVKDMVWFKDDKGESFECYRLQYHSQNNPIEGVTTCIGGDGKFRYRTKIFEKNPIKNDGLNANSTPESYMEYLKQKNLRYTINYDWEDDNRCYQSFSVYNPETDLMTKTTFTKDLEKDKVLCLFKEYYDSNNNIEKSVHYNQDCVEITEFKDKKLL